MTEDPTKLDSLGWEILKKALNQRLVVTRVRFMPSKANRVWAVETDVRPVIVKKSLTGKCAIEFESLLQARLAGIDVPFPLIMEEEYLIMEYVPGDSCEVLINSFFSAVAADGIGKWLAGYHAVSRDGRSCKIMGDAALSNFLLFDGKVFGVDLEDSRIGDPLDDVGQISARVLGSEPFFTPIKFDLCLRVLRSYERASGTDVVESSRSYISKHLQADARSKPLFRRTFLQAARTIERGWPRLA